MKNRFSVLKHVTYRKGKFFFAIFGYTTLSEYALLCCCMPTVDIEKAF